MLDVFDFVEDKGGDPRNIRESQRRRHAPEEAVDQVIALYEDQRKSPSTPRLLSIGLLVMPMFRQPDTKLPK